MSRSYRHACVFYGTRTHKRAKRDANRRVRHTVDVYQHADYKRLYESWNIREFRYYASDASDRLLRR